MNVSNAWTKLNVKEAPRYLLIMAIGEQGWILTKFTLVQTRMLAKEGIYLIRCILLSVQKDTQESCAKSVLRDFKELDPMDVANVQIKLQILCKLLDWLSCF